MTPDGVISSQESTGLPASPVRVVHAATCQGSPRPGEADEWVPLARGSADNGSPRPGSPVTPPPHVSAALCGSDPGRESPASLFARLGESEWQALVDREGWKINAVENEPRSFAAYLKMITPIGAPPPMDKRLRKRRPRGPLVRDWAPDL